MMTCPSCIPKHSPNPALWTRKTSKDLPNAKKEELEYMLRKCVKLVLSDALNSDVQLTGLRWVLTRKINAVSGKKMYSARLVALSHLSNLRHVLHGNAPTVNLSSMRAMLCITPTWNTMSGKGVDIVCRGVTKAYLQGEKPPRSILYKPPKEFFEFFQSAPERYSIQMCYSAVRWRQGLVSTVHSFHG